MSEENGSIINRVGTQYLRCTKRLDNKSCVCFGKIYTTVREALVKEIVELTVDTIFPELVQQISGCLDSWENVRPLPCVIPCKLYFLICWEAYFKVRRNLEMVIKKKISWSCIFILMVTMTSCSNKQSESSILSDRKPMIMIENQIYLDTGEQISIEIDDSSLMGTITSEVAGSEIPVKNGQSNFGCVGAEYASYEDSIVVMINNQWQLFCKENDKLTLEKIIELSHQGQNLSWNDFESYDSKEIGSGLYILRYEIDESYYLLIGGNNPREKPAYIRLIRAGNPEDDIDIREDNVEEFISK